jgi:hypothetical protein
MSKFSNCPNVVGKPRSHRGSSLHGLVNAAEVVEGNIKGATTKATILP